MNDGSNNNSNISVATIKKRVFENNTAVMQRLTTPREASLSVAGGLGCTGPVTI